MLAELGSEMNSGIFVLTEIHLHEEIKDEEIYIEGYDIFRSDRQTFKNGGVVAYVRTNLNLESKMLYS